MHKVIDNFLNIEDFEAIQQRLMSSSFPWYYNDSMGEAGTTGSNNCFFHHHIYSKHKVWSDLFDIAEPLLKKLSVSALFELRANLVVARDKTFQSDWHYDFNHKKGKTAVLYINDNNGYTVIDKFKKHKIESKANRIVIFNNEQLHKMVSQTNSQRRVVLNINFFQQ